MNEYILVRFKIQFTSKVKKVFEEKENIDLINELNDIFAMEQLKGLIISNNKIDTTLFPLEWEIKNTELVLVDNENCISEFHLAIKSTLNDVIDYFQKLLSLITYKIYYFDVVYNNKIINYTLRRGLLIDKTLKGDFIYKLINLDQDITYFKCEARENTYIENKYLAEQILKIETIFRLKLINGVMLDNVELLMLWSDNVVYPYLKTSSLCEYNSSENIPIEINLLKPKDEDIYFLFKNMAFSTLFEDIRLTQYNNSKEKKLRLIDTVLVGCLCLISMLIAILGIENILSLNITVIIIGVILITWLIYLVIRYGVIRGIKKLQNIKRYKKCISILKGDI